MPGENVRVQRGEMRRLDDYRWLLGAEGARQLQEAAASELPVHRLTAHVRRTLSPERTHLLLEQVELRRRARRKFSRAEQMFFTRRSLQQATDEVTAAYKASRFPADAALADLCSGIGGDLLALASRGAVAGWERDPALALLAAANVRCLLDPAEARIVCGDAGKADLTQFAAWHCDPDRRPGSRRSTRVELHEPDAGRLEQMLRSNSHAAIKLAPAAVVPHDWPPRAEREWISVGGQCKQLVAWFGELTQMQGRRRATVLDCSGAAATFTGRGHLQPPHRENVGSYVYEPDAAILAADLCGEVAAQFDLHSFAETAGYLTSDRLVETGGLSAFAVRDVMPMDPKRLKAELRRQGIGRVEVKKRGVPHEPAKVSRSLRGSGVESATLILCRMSGQVTAIVCRRLDGCQ